MCELRRHDSILGKQCQTALDPTGHSLNTSVLKPTIPVDHSV